MLSNNNNKNIFYFSLRVENIESEDEFFSNLFAYYMLNTRYIEGIETRENLGEGKIKITTRDEN